MVTFFDSFMAEDVVEEEDESLIVTNEHELYVVYNNEVLGCDSTFVFEL